MKGFGSKTLHTKLSNCLLACPRRSALACVSTESRRQKRTGSPIRSQMQAKCPAVPDTRKAYVITSPGALSRLLPRAEPLPPLQQGKATVEVHAIGLNFADLFSVLGLYTAFQESECKTPGLEFSGRVLAVNGDDRSTVKVGDRVVGITKFGAYATHIQLDTAYLQPFDKSWSFEQAAAYPVQALTALYGLQSLGGISPGACILVHSAAGGVGLQALKIAKHYKCTVMGTVGSSSKLQLLRDQFSAEGQEGPGKMHFVARSTPDQFKADAAAFLASEGRQGFDIVLDSLQGDYFQPGYDLIAPCGRAIVFGAGSLTPGVGADASLLSLKGQRSIPSTLWTLLWNLPSLIRTVTGFLQRPKLDLLKLPGENKGVLGFNLIWLYENLDLFTGLYTSLDSLQLDAPLVGSTYSFDELPAALEHLQSGKSVGKVVIKVEHENGNGRLLL